MVQINYRVFFLKCGCPCCQITTFTCINCLSGFWKQLPPLPPRQGPWGAQQGRTLGNKVGHAADRGTRLSHAGLWAMHLSCLPTFLREVGAYNSIQSLGLITAVKWKCRCQHPDRSNYIFKETLSMWEYWLHLVNDCAIQISTMDHESPKFQSFLPNTFFLCFSTGTTENFQSQANSVNSIFHFNPFSGTSTSLFLKLLMCNSVSDLFVRTGNQAHQCGSLSHREAKGVAQGHSQVHCQMNPGPSPKVTSWVQTSLPLIFQYISWPCTSGIVLWNS